MFESNRAYVHVNTNPCSSSSSPPLSFDGPFITTNFTILDSKKFFFSAVPSRASKLIRSTGSVNAITTSDCIQRGTDVTVVAWNIHSWQMSRADPRHTCHLSTTDPDELRATTSTCYVSNNARKISPSYHYIGWYVGRVQHPLTEKWWTSYEIALSRHRGRAALKTSGARTRANFPTSRSRSISSINGIGIVGKRDRRLLAKLPFMRE